MTSRLIDSEVSPLGQQAPHDGAAPSDAHLTVLVAEDHARVSSSDAALQAFKDDLRVDMASAVSVSPARILVLSVAPAPAPAPQAIAPAPCVLVALQIRHLPTAAAASAPRAPGLAAPPLVREPGARDRRPGHGAVLGAPPRASLHCPRLPPPSAQVVSA